MALEVEAKMAVPDLASVRDTLKRLNAVGGSLTLEQAQTALQDADNTYIQGLYDALVSKVDLDKAYGRIK